MGAPLFFVIARVVSRDGALEKWREVLAGLCKVSKTERYSNSYYWGHDLDGETDTLWGLEGYYHATGFFLDHVSSDEFKAEMRKVDDAKLLRTVQGIGSPDYDLRYYDLFGGFLTRKDDPDRDRQDSFVCVVHFSAAEGRRKQLLGVAADCADLVEATAGNGVAPFGAVQSFAVLKEVNDLSLVSLYIRTRSQEAWEALEASDIFQRLLDHVKPITTKTEKHRSQAFIGHINQDCLTRAL
ncbi:hypothetical protein AYO21_09414 [Fonsecaea monophora]|uniref:ABM domain-containing protein n=1 Tax=Fonsecaea monophora TaxID=254056 RepID=A0A177EZQ1_9EURO|nr:hypothetical protein AYO21_09414 [Fonsecaea monophora]OAG36429.1 hypothetical protein AYO21_09414 [Fonsecaea monophora]